MHNSISTTIEEQYTFGLGKFVFQHHQGSFALTPASKIALEAIYQNQHLLAGRGIDWGCGTGCLAITAARIEKVIRVIGLDITTENIREARQNIRDNNVKGKVEVELSDSYAPKTLSGRRKLEMYKKQSNFILSNPPSSEGDDGFEFRRVVLRDARSYLKEGGVVFLNISYQYGKKRIDNLTQQIKGYVYGGILSSTRWVSFDLHRPELLHCLETYVEEEHRGGFEYEFQNPDIANHESVINAKEALACYKRTGKSPLSKWQTHLFHFEGIG
jgi:methylase of polypeptide subunit release factors